MAGRIVDYMGHGLASALPTAATVDGDLTTGAAGFYYAYDTTTLYTLNRNGTPAWEPVGRQFRGALVYYNADNTAVNLSSSPAQSWDAASYDTDSFWSAGSPTRLTIPSSGVSKVILKSAMALSLFASGSNSRVRLTKGGTAAFLGGCGQQADSTSTLHRLSLTSPVLEVSAAEYFEVEHYCSDTSVTQLQNENWFSIEVVE